MVGYQKKEGGGFNIVHACAEGKSAGWDGMNRMKQYRCRQAAKLPSCQFERNEAMKAISSDLQHNEQ